MLEVGNLASFEEDRAHFGAWCVTSSPLILGHNVTDQAANDAIWDIVSNTEAIAVNQAWVGHPGWLVDSYFPEADSDVYAWATSCEAGSSTQQWAILGESGSSSYVFRPSDGLVLDYSQGTSELFLKPYSGLDQQGFDIDSNGQFLATCNGCCGSSNCCLDAYNFNGPVVGKN